MKKTPFLFLWFFVHAFSPICGDESQRGCFQVIEKEFFNEKFVNEALQLHRIYQSSWYLFNSALKVNAQAIPLMIQERAEKMIPNPFQYPFQPKEAALLLNQVLFEVFDQTVKQFGLTNLSSSAFNQTAINDMYRYIREKQSFRFKSCFGEEIEKEIENGSFYPSPNSL